eukprot:m.351877 g.351877  ORF g.351877 m.351877 type:complete len:226 (-) comp16387_c0_seq1:543-1220(-)
MGNITTSGLASSWFGVPPEVQAAIDESQRKRASLVQQQQANTLAQAKRELMEGAKPGHSPRPVLNYLYLGDRFTVRDLHNLTSCHIGYVLQISSTVTSEPVNAQMRTAGVEYWRLPADDTEDFNIIMEFEKACSFLDKARDAATHGDELHRALVYCDEGVSRAPTVVLAFLVHIGWTLKGAIDHLKRLKPDISPNTGFFRQLIEFEERVHGNTTCTEADYAKYFA